MQSSLSAKLCQCQHDITYLWYLITSLPLKYSLVSDCRNVGTVGGSGGLVGLKFRNVREFGAQSYLLPSKIEIKMVNFYLIRSFILFEGK